MCGGSVCVCVVETLERESGWMSAGYPGMSEGLAVTTMLHRVSGCDWSVALRCCGGLVCRCSGFQNIDKRLKQIFYESSYPLNKVNR